MGTKLFDTFRPRSKTRRKGFSLVEVIIAISIIAVLTAIAAPALISYTEQSRSQKDSASAETLTDAVMKGLMIDSIYEEVEAYGVRHNVSCYIDSDKEANHNLNKEYETTRYSFDDDSRLLDAVPYYAAGAMYGVTITFEPQFINGKTVYVIEDGVVNKFVPLKQARLSELPELYQAVIQTIGTELEQKSNTYENSEFTVFIAMSEVGEKIEAYGQYSGTNLTVEDATTYDYKSTTDRMTSDGEEIGNGEIYEDYVDDDDTLCYHTSVNIVNARSATCTDTGYTGETICARCGRVTRKGYEIPAKGHILVTKNAKNATCTEAGYSGDATCTACKAVVTKGQILPQLEHVTTTKNQREATCAVPGYTGDSVCVNCNKTVSRGATITTNQHGATEIKGRANATCTEAGYTGDTYCTVCSKKLEDGEILHAWGHDYSPTWTWNGVSSATATFVCSRCQDKHTLSTSTISVRVISEETCTSQGQKLYTAHITFKGLEYSTQVSKVVAAPGHKYKAVVTAPTCLTAGYTTNTCSVCKDTYTSNSITPLGHNMGEWTTIKAATCLENGMQRRNCSRCTHYETMTITKSSHSYSEPTWLWDNYSSATATFTCVHCSTKTTLTGGASTKVVKVGTCVQDGEKTHTVTVNLNNKNYTTTKTEIVKATGHGAVEVRNKKDATCTTDGHTGDTHCTVCGEKISAGKVIKADGHRYDRRQWTWTGYTAAVLKFTCTKCGDTQSVNASITSAVSVTASCSEAGTRVYTAKATFEGTEHTSYKTESIPSKGHTYTKSVVQATCTTPGYTTYTCSCGHRYTTDNVSALGHNMSTPTAAQNATCTTDGYKESKCSRCGIVEKSTILATGHRNTEIRNQKAAKCTTAGYTGDTYCKDCNTKLATGSATPATGHLNTELKGRTDATCTTNGYSGDIYCNDCKTNISTGSVVPAFNHTFGNPTWAWTGYLAANASFKCTTCGHTETKMATLSSQVIDTKTCEISGQTIYTATVSFNSQTYKDTKTKTDLAEGHKYSTVVTQPTCITYGYTTYTCTACGHRYTNSMTQALGHSCGSWYTIKEATCTAIGNAQRDCTRCGYNEVKDVAINPNNHTGTSTFGGTKEVHTKYTCCGATISSSHTYNQDSGVQYTAATCLQPRYNYMKCACGYNPKNSSYITATGSVNSSNHTGTSIYGGTSSVHTKYSCCGATISSSHTYDRDSGVQYTAATCTAKRKNYKSCVCGYNPKSSSYTIEVGSVNSSNHTGTSTYGGTSSVHTKYTCCGATISSSHTYDRDSGVMYSAATCTAKQKNYKKCVCGYNPKSSSHLIEVGSVNSSNHTGSVINGGTSGVHQKYSCCGATYSTSHSYTVDSGVQYTAATCIAKRKNYKQCACGYNPKSSSYTVEVGSVNSSNHAGTSTYGGTSSVHTKYTCCGATISATHTYTKSTQTAATCTTKGTSKYTCACGYSYTSQDIAINSSNHTGSVVNGGTSGVHTKYSCCGATVSTSHSYTVDSGVQYTAATCTAKRKNYKSCACGYNPKSSSHVVETGSALGHASVNGGTSGVHTKCSRCGTTLSTTHSYSKSTQTAATCTTKGTSKYTCACGYSYTSQDIAINSSNHTGSVVNGGTSGVHTKYSCCGATVSTSHSYSKSTQTAATCTAKGTSKYTCACGYYYTSQDIAALGHSSTYGGTSGVHTKCSRCGTTLSSSHSYDTNSGSVYQSASCVNAQYNYLRCACGYNPWSSSYIVWISGAWGHSWGSYSNTSNPDCNNGGNKRRYCSRGCGAYEDVWLAPLGHIEVGGGTASVHAYCTRCGVTTAGASSHAYNKVANSGTCRYCYGCGYYDYNHNGNPCSDCGYVAGFSVGNTIALKSTAVRFYYQYQYPYCCSYDKNNFADNINNYNYRNLSIAGFKSSSGTEYSSGTYGASSASTICAIVKWDFQVKGSNTWHNNQKHLFNLNDLQFP